MENKKAGPEGTGPVCRDIPGRGNIGEMGVQTNPDKTLTTDAVIGIEAIKGLYVNGNARISYALEQLLNGKKAEIDRVAAHVGRAAREAMNAG